MTKSLASRKLEAEITLANLGIEKARLELLEKIEEHEYRTSRVFRFTEGVDADTALRAVEWLDRMVEATKQPATIAFSSYGGKLLDGLALFDAMEGARDVGLNLTTVCSGYTASMASILMQGGTTRLATPHAWFHIHEPWTSLDYGKTSDFRDEARAMEDVWTQSLNILAARSTLTAQQIRHRFERTEQWLSATEALELGFIDGITHNSPEES